MKRFYNKALLCLLMAATVTTVRAQETTTYDLVKAAEGSTLAPTYGETVTTGGADLQLISVADDDFDNRIAVGPSNRNNGTSNGFIFRTSGDWKGLWSQYNNRNISVLNLKAGDKVTLTISKGAETLQIVGGATVVSGQPITVSADGNLDFITTGGVYIEKIVIEPYVAVASETVTVGVIGSDNTYDLVQAAEGSTLAPTYGETVTTGGADLQLISVADDDFDNRFAVGPTNRNNGTNAGFIFRTAGDWKGLWSQYADRRFSILNLKKGNKVTLTISKGAETLKFVDGDIVVSGQEYTVEADGNLDFVTTDGVYIESVNIVEPSENIGAATLVSTHALDFTDVDDIQAYVAVTAEAGTVTFKQVKMVPAATPLYLTATEAVSVDVPVLDGEAETIESNLLKGSATNTTALTSTDETKYYVFGVKDGEAGFYPVSSESMLTSAAGKAYLQLTAEQAAAARRITIVFDDNQTTGIETIDHSPLNIVYDLQGRRVAEPRQGIYIKGGKKVIMK